MNRPTTLTAALRCLLASLFIAGTTFAGEPPKADAVRLAEVPEVRDALVKLDIWLEGQRSNLDLPGFSAGVVHDQELLWSKGYGFADITNRIVATDQTLYRVASITKTFTATAIMQLVEQGKLSLEDPVSKHLPWFTPKNADPLQPIKVWNLLSHTAGLIREPPGTDWDQLDFTSAEAARASAGATALGMPTQTRLKYSNYGFLIAGELVTQLAGVPYPRQVQEKILRPLGMTNSIFLEGTETRPGLALPYGRRLAGRPRGLEDQIDMHGVTAVGSLVSNVRDLAKWASFQFNESDQFHGPVLPGRAVREMHRPRFLVADWSQGWGLGWRLTRGEKRADIDHGGSLPGYKSRLLISPASKVAIILLINADDGPRELAGGAMKIVSEPIAKAAAPAETPAAATDLARFEGLYRDRSGEDTRIVALGGKLRMIGLESDDIENATTTLKQTGPTTFLTQARDSAITSDVEAIVEFTVDPSGRAKSVTVENGSYRLRRVE
jgi:CubicO group peptidase (beta-lactamase class C family)